MLWNPSTYRFECSYKPCGHVGDIVVHHHERLDLGTRLCPECNLFTYKRRPFSVETLGEFREVLKREFKEDENGYFIFSGSGAKK